MTKWASFIKEVNTVASYVCLGFLIPLRQDFDWVLSLPLLYLTSAIFILAIRADSKLETVLNLIVLALAYIQFTTLFILAVFILNFKVFHFGFKKTRYVKTSAEHSIAWAKSEYMDATSYLNSTLDCTTEDSFVSETALKREMRSYGIVSIMVERVEYVGSSTDASFILYDASQGHTDKSSDMPIIENSELNKEKEKGNGKIGLRKEENASTS